MCQFFNKRGYPVSFDSFERGTTVFKQIDRQSALHKAEKDNID